MKKAEYTIEQIEVAVLILAIDTTSRAGSVALAREGAVLYEMTGDPSLTHGQRLPLDFTRACREAGVSLEDIDLFAVAAGPGSFTGLRVGIAAIQGLAFAMNRAVVPVTTFEAVAAAARSSSPKIAAWVDAQRGEVFAQLFERRPVPPDGTGASPLDAPISASPEAVLARWSDKDLGDASFEGDGAVRYADRIRAALGMRTRIADAVPPLASAIARIAAKSPDRAVLPHAIVPVYVRRPDAELARERRGGMP